MQNYKKKCEEQEKIISLVKKSLRTDKLEIDFEKYKKDTTMKIKSLEDEKLQIQNEKMLLQVMEISVFRFVRNRNLIF